MKRILILGLILSLFVIGNAQPLKIVCDEWPPYQAVENGNVTGFSTEIVQQVLAQMSLSHDPIKAFPWKRALMMVETGEADALFSANYSEERTAFAFYPDEPLVTSPWVVWKAKTSDAYFADLADLKGKSIGVVRGYSYTPEFWEYVRANSKFEEVADDETNFRKLDKGRLDFIVAELGNGLQIAQKMGAQVQPFKDAPIKEDGLFIMFNKKNVSQETVSAFNEALKKFKATDQYKKIYQKYFGE